MLLATAVGVVVTATPSAASTADRTSCQTSNLTLSLGPAVSEQTGEHAVILRLTNAAEPCTVRGYPTLRLSRNGHVMTFHHAHGGMYVGHQKPRTITVGQRRCWGLSTGNDPQWRISAASRLLAATGRRRPTHRPTTLTLLTVLAVLVRAAWRRKDRAYRPA
jgi:hypothetical protein